MRSLKTKIYRAEQPFKFKDGNRGDAMTLEDCQKFVNKVLRSDYVRNNYITEKKIRVRGGWYSSTAFATYEKGQAVIRLPRWARNEFVILHELTHHLHTYNYEKWSHDLEFAEIQRSLVKEFRPLSEFKALKQRHKVLIGTMK